MLLTFYIIFSLDKIGQEVRSCALVSMKMKNTTMIHRFKSLIHIMEYG